MSDVYLYILSVILACLGILGVFLPFFPGVPLVFAGALLASIVSGFSFISQSTIYLLGFLTILSVAIDYFSGLLGAKYAGAGLYGSLGAIAGAIFGVGLIGPIGIILGPALGVLIFEFISKKPLKKSVKTATYTFLSTLSGIAINGIIALSIITIFIVSIFV